jgi:hypothetical protein
MKACAVVAVLALCLVGCKKGTIIGKWKIDPASMDERIVKDPTMARMMENFTLDFKSDGTFIVRDPNGKVATDRYTVKEKQVIVGDPSSQAMKLDLKLNEDGTLSAFALGEELRFKRQ